MSDVGSLSPAAQALLERPGQPGPWGALLDECARAADDFCRVRWGALYDPEMMLERAVCHLLRHRRQLERWPR